MLDFFLYIRIPPKTLLSFCICFYLPPSRVGCSVSVKDFRSSWRSGEVFLAILCSLRPQLVDLSVIRSRSNQENLEEAFHLAERELHIARLLEPQGEATTPKFLNNNSYNDSYFYLKYCSYIMSFKAPAYKMEVRCCHSEHQ